MKKDAILSQLSRMKKKELFQVIEEQFKTIEELKAERDLFKSDYENLQKDFVKLQKKVEELRASLSKPIIITQTPSSPPAREELSRLDARDILELAFKTGVLKDWLSSPQYQGTWEKE